MHTIAAVKFWIREFASDTHCPIPQADVPTVLQSAVGVEMKEQFDINITTRTITDKKTGAKVKIRATARGLKTLRKHGML